MRRFSTVAAVAALLISCQPQTPPLDILGPVPELRHGFLEGYLHGEPLLNCHQFLPAPPEPGSAKQLADDAASEALRPLEGSARWDMAARDANLQFPDAASIFNCALGIEVSESDTPATYRLLQRSLTDLGLPTYPAKNAYQRLRPFVVNGEALCSPQERALLENDGSYPSGHSAIGWGWALMLSQIAPERAEGILNRGRQYAQSRMVCNVHWLSDIEAGMAVGAGAFARLQNSALFTATLTAAKAELAAGRAPTPDSEACAAETTALLLAD